MRFIKMDTKVDSESAPLYAVEKSDSEAGGSESTAAISTESAGRLSSVAIERESPGFDEDGALRIKTKGQLESVKKATVTENTKVASDRLRAVIQGNPLQYETEAERAEVGFHRLKGMEASDEVEATMSTQMITLDNEINKMWGYANDIQNSWEVRQDAMKLAVRLSRQYSEHVKALVKYRSKGIQTVRHITIDNRDGGQTAILTGGKKE